MSLDKFNAFGQQLHTIFNFAEIEQRSYDMAIAYFKCRGEENLPLFTAPDKISEFSISACKFPRKTDPVSSSSEDIASSLLTEALNSLISGQHTGDAFFLLVNFLKY